MEAMTITEVSKGYGISTRMLRYYEQIGLIKSYRRVDYAYRMYDEDALARLRQILILRKLRIPLKQIMTILRNPAAVTAIEVFRQNVSEIDEEISALSTIKSILRRLIDELNKTANVQIDSMLASDSSLLASIESLSPTSINFKEDKAMDELKKAEKNLTKLTDVRIVYLPPATIAAAHYVGDDPETKVYAMIDRFVRSADLCKIKPDLRHYGFNHPNPVDETGAHGYEAWVTIPEDMKVPSPLVKKQFAGGLYAAHMIRMGDFHEWEWFFDWIQKSDKYTFTGDIKDQEHMCGLLEEHLNYVNHLSLNNTEPEDMQLDLLIPVALS